MAVGLWLAAPGCAQAHKLRVFAAAEGTQISGYAYFSSGARAAAATVTVSAPDGHVIMVTTTDDAGAFSLSADQRLDYSVTVDAGDGHRATTLVPAVDFPELPSPPLLQNPPLAQAQVASVPLVASQQEWQAYLDRSISRQLRPLREQLEMYQEKVWMHDVMGGIGTIFGIAGVAYGLRRRVGKGQGGVS